MLINETFRRHSLSPGGRLSLRYLGGSAKLRVRKSIASRGARGRRRGGARWVRPFFRGTKRVVPGYQALLDLVWAEAVSFVRKAAQGHRSGEEDEVVFNCVTLQADQRGHSGDEGRVRSGEVQDEGQWDKRSEFR